MAGLLTIIPQGNLGGINIDATLEEIHSDTLQVTEHPVESGALITDHSFKRPCEVLLRCGWSNSSDAAFAGAITALISTGAASISDYVTGIYSQLLSLQQSRVQFSITTSIRVYNNMMITALQLTRDQKTSQALMVTATCREVIIVSTQSMALPAMTNQANPASTAEVENVGVAQVIPGSPAPGGASPPQNWGNNGQPLRIVVTTGDFHP